MVIPESSDRLRRNGLKLQIVCVSSMVSFAFMSIYCAKLAFGWPLKTHCVCCSQIKDASNPINQIQINSINTVVIFTLSSFQTLIIHVADSF